MVEYHISISDIESIVTIIAIILGGIWAYLLFVKNREKYPKALINHEVQKVKFENEVLVRLTIQIENIGKVILPVISGDVWLQQMQPVNDSIKQAIADFQNQNNKADIGWPIIAKRKFRYEKENDYELEPGEIDKFEFDFLIDKSVKTIQFYTHIENVEKSNKGWNYTSIHNLDIHE